MMEIKIRERNSIIIFDLIGDIKRPDTNVRTIHQTVKDHLDAGKRDFLFNLQNVVSIDDYGAGEFLASYISIHNVGGRLNLTNIPNKIYHLFQPKTFDPMVNYARWEIFDDEEEAIKSFF